MPPSSRQSRGRRSQRFWSETVKTVTVKMVKSQTNVAALEALIGELQIMIQLGTYLNVVNLLGACTKTLVRGTCLFKRFWLK